MHAHLCHVWVRVEAGGCLSSPGAEAADVCGTRLGPPEGERALLAAQAPGHAFTHNTMMGAGTGGRGLLTF